MGETIEREPLEAYLRGRLPEREGLRLTGLKRTPGGMSRQTWFVDLEWSGAEALESQRVTIRFDHDIGSVVPNPLVHEYNVMACLYGSAVPVAEPLWFEEDAGILGRPFYVRDCVAGDASPKRIFAPGNEELRARMGRQLVELLAALHTLDWRAAGMADVTQVPTTPRDAALLELRALPIALARNRGRARSGARRALHLARAGPRRRRSRASRSCGVTSASATSSTGTTSWP